MEKIILFFFILDKVWFLGNCDRDKFFKNFTFCRKNLHHGRRGKKNVSQIILHEEIEIFSDWSSAVWCSPAWKEGKLELSTSTNQRKVRENSDQSKVEKMMNRDFFFAERRYCVRESQNLVQSE